jgi:hypothetical protein
MPEPSPNQADAAPADDRGQGVHYERIREQLRRSRSRQFGLGAIFLLTAAIAGTLAWLRQSGEGFSRVIVPLGVLCGFAISFTGVVLLLESPRQAVKGKQRLSRTFFRYGLLALLLGLPGSILLAVAMFYVAQM